MTRAQSAPLRAVVFSDVNGAVSARLLAETLRFARREQTIEVVAVVVSGPEAFHVGRARRALRIGRRLVAAALNDDVPFGSVLEPRLDLDHIERRWRIPVLAPESGDPNEPAFVRRLQLALRPDVALSFYCLRIFRRPLLDLFEQCVNYHDSLLPAHRGVQATSFSVYAGDRLTGFTYHRMDESIDGGPILLQGTVAVGENEGIVAVKRRKLTAAVSALPDALRLVAKHAAGRPQPGGGEYHSRRALAALLDVDRPQDLTSHELARRLRAFGGVRATIGGVEYPVSRLRPATRGRLLAFEAADGVVLEPDRLVGLPVAAYRLARVIDGPPLAVPPPAPDGRAAPVGGAIAHLPAEPTQFEC